MDAIYAVPRPLQLRTILIMFVWVGVFSAAWAMEFPQLWRGAVVVDLFAASVLFTLAACRQWMINAPRPGVG